MKKSLLICIFLLIASLLPASDLRLEAHAYPSSVSLSWNAVEGSSFYDLYDGQAFIVRLSSDNLAYTVTGLAQKSDHAYALAARNSENKDLAVAWASAKTTSWEGTYRWVNPTEDDNGGKMKEMELTVKLASDPEFGTYSEIWTPLDGKQMRVFPFGPLRSSGEWVEWKAEGDMAEAYRENCKRFNTSAFKPSRWRITKIYLQGDFSGVDIHTKAFGFEVETHTSYTFSINAEGKRQIEFRNEGTGIANSALFHNPGGDSEAPFLLTEIE